MSPAEEAEAWLRIMDEHGMEPAVLFPTRAATLSRLREKEFACAVARAFNECVAREYATVSPRLRLATAWTALAATLYATNLPAPPLPWRETATSA